MADRFVVGDTVTLTNTFAVAGTNTDPSTVTLAVTDPTGTTTSYTHAGGTVTKSTTGVYVKDLTASAAGVWIYTWTGTGTAADVENGSFTVEALDAYPLTEYATLDELKGYLSQAGNVTIGAGDDIQIAGALRSASRQIDTYCNRRFHRDASTSTRVYIAESPRRLKVDDISTSTGMAIFTDSTGSGTFDRSWSATDYQLLPLNGVNEGIGGWPFWLIEAIDDEAFPVDRRARVQVTARWGWAAVPSPVHQACLIQAAYLFRRKDAVTGILGATDFGSVRVRSGLDPDAADLLAQYRRGDIVRAVG